MPTIRDEHGRDRHAAGSPASIGGRYATQQAPGAAAQFPVVADTPELVAEQNRARSRAIAANTGYFPATVQVPLTDPRHAKAVARWHEQARSTAEIDTRNPFPLIPEDWGEQAAGKSARGKRRMARRTFAAKDGSVSLRTFPMTRIRSYAEAAGEGSPFDVPVEITVDGKPLIGQVRVTHHGGGVYTATPMGFPMPHSAEVSESMQAMLGSRRPGLGLERRKQLAAKQRERYATAGVQLTKVDSSFLQAVGYNRTSQEVIVALEGSRGESKLYSYRGVTVDEWRAFQGAPVIGSAFSTIIKYVNGVARNPQGAPRDEVHWCERCSVAFTRTHEHFARPARVGNREVASDRNALIELEHERSIKERLLAL